MKIETRDAVRNDERFTVREDGGDRYIEGYFARFDDVYDMGWGVTESVDRHAFDGTLGDDVRVLINHDTTKVLGRTAAGTAALRVDDVGLWASAKINPDDTDAMNEVARMERGDVTGASFGFEIKDIERQYDQSKGTIHRILKDVRLFEVSVCTFPACRKTAVGVREEDRAAAAEENRAWQDAQRERLKKLKKEG
ncbi:MAG: HK97 family phage prohead protease [Clostridia bacterium]|nr:HK97 family phage prohead protease [Clostridia bacterium]